MKTEDIEKLEAFAEELVAKTRINDEGWIDGLQPQDLKKRGDAWI